MPRLFLIAVFFASGFAALLYQIIWQRMLTLFTGADVYSATLVVAAFMAGLGFGHLAGGYLADRLGSRHRVIAFAVCELAVAAFAAVSTNIYYDLLYVRLGTWALSRSSVGALIFLLTLWPTLFMGMSLPLISRILTDDARHPARWIPRLYGWNTLGAASGSFVAVLVLFPTFAFGTSVRLGAVLSAACGVSALLLAPRLVARRATEPPPPVLLVAAGPPSGADRHLSMRAWLMIYALSGFVALSLEIVWFRVLGIVLKSTASTFGLLLGVYLGGIGVGSLIAQHRRLQRMLPARAFFLLQTGVPVWAALSLTLLVFAVDRVTWAAPLWTFMASGSPLSDRAIQSGAAFVLYATLSVGLVGPPTLMMGLSFALLQRAVQTDLGQLGRRLGWLQTANILGATAGALLTGLLLLEWLGSAATLRLLAGMGAIFLGLYCWTARLHVIRAAALAAALGVAIAAVPSNDLFWSRLHGSRPDRSITSEDASGLVVLRDDLTGESTRVFLSGISQSWLPYGSIHTALGALPAFLHPRPVHVAVIGLGSGDTAFAIGGRAETETIDSIEIVRPQLDALRRLGTQARYPGLGMLLADARVHHQFADARAVLRRSARRYDVIEADALMPKSAYAGNLYSVEYFGLLRDSLSPGGLAVTWTPTERTRASLLSVFPYVLMFRSLAIGSTSPVVFDRAAIEERLRQDFSRRYYADAGVNVEAVLAPLLSEGPVRYDPTFDRTSLGDVNHDLFPQDEFARPYQAGAVSLIAPLGRP